MTMPALGESVTEGTVTRWLKAEGDQVEVDEPLLEVSTDKVDTEIPSPVAGTLSKILVGEDETVPVGADLAVVGGSGAGAAPSAPPQEQRAPQAEETAQAAEPQPSAQASDRPAEAGSALEQEAAEHQQAAEQSLTEDKPRGDAPAAAPAAPAPAPRRARAPRPVTRVRPTPRPTSRRWCASSPPRTASTSARSRAPASAAASASRTSWRRPRPPRRRLPRLRPHRLPVVALPAPAAGGLAQARHHREDEPPAQGHRRTDGRVAAGLRPADHGHRGGRHQGGPSARPRQEGLRARARASSSRSCPSSPLPRSRR